MEHLKYLAIFDFVMAGITLLTTLFMALTFGGAMVLTEASGEQLIFFGVGAVTSLLIGLVLSGLVMLAGLQVRQGRGRILQTVLSVLWIGNIPLGTALALYGLWVCWMNEETKVLFEAPAYD